MATGNLLSWAVTFLIIAIVAGLIGFGGISEDASYIAKILFGIFLVLFLISALSGAMAPSYGGGGYYGQSQYGPAYRSS